MRMLSKLHKLSVKMMWIGTTTNLFRSVRCPGEQSGSKCCGNFHREPNSQQGVERNKLREWARFGKARSGPRIEDRGAKVKGPEVQFTLWWQSTNLAVFKFGPPLD